MVPVEAQTALWHAASWKSRVTPTAVLVIATICAAMLALPGQTETTKYLNDLLIFLDGAHRLSVGQVPNRDFHSALGPLAYYIPALGYWLTGSFGAALPVGTALVIIVLAPIMAYILDSRLRPAIAVPFAAFLLLVLAVPVNLGESVTALSYGMFYNRIGWAVLALLLVMYLRPERAHKRGTLLDALSAALLTLLLLYLKVSYGAVALGFLVTILIVSRQRAWAGLAIVVTLVAAMLVEAVWRSTGAYLADIALAAEVSGGVRGTLADQLTLGLNNLPDYAFFALLAGLALWSTRSWRDLIFFSFCAGAGYVVLNQNFQTYGILTLHAAGAVAAERLIRADVIGWRNRRWQLGVAAPLLLFAFLLPMIVHSATALTIHTVVAVKRAGVAIALPNLQGVRLVNILSEAHHVHFTNYINTIRSGERVLAGLVAEPERVFVMDFVNPFSAGLGLAPPRGDSTWHHWSRSFNNEHLIPPEDLLRDVRVVLEPKHPIERWTYGGLKHNYLPYIQANYDFAGENADWWVYVARDADER